jgi:hypothetical protein
MPTTTVARAVSIDYINLIAIATPAFLSPTDEETLTFACGPAYGSFLEGVCTGSPEGLDRYVWFRATVQASIWEDVM